MKPPGYISPSRETIPAELAAIPHWLAWRLAARTDKTTGEVKFTKEPINPATGGLGKSTDASTWSSLDEAWARYERDGLGGVGFALNGDGLVGIDIDHCRDAATGRIDDEALEVVRSLDTYVEVSPSGTGLRAFARATLPPKGRKRGRYEMYESGRYLTVTGAHLQETPTTIEDRPEEVLAFHRRIFGSDAKAGAPRNRTAARPGREASTSDPDADDQVIARARAAKSGKMFDALLSKGDWSGQRYPSQSEADLALCSFLAHAGADAGCIDRIVRDSALYRSKWDKVHSSDGSTYGAMTIALALSAFRADESDDQELEYHPINAGRRMVRQHGDGLLFCAGEWRQYDGKRWREDNGKCIERITREVVETYKEEADGLYAQVTELRKEAEAQDSEEGKAKVAERADRVEQRAKSCWSFYIQVARPKGVKDIAEAASWDLTVQQDELDADPYLLNVQNGTVDLRTGALLPHSRRDLITKIAPCSYEPEISSELWDRFLRDAFGEDDELLRYVQRAIGSSLIGLQLEDLILLFIGPGGTGKSTMLEAGRCAIGDYGKPVPFDIFLERKHSGGTTPELASLPGVRMITSAEPKENVGFDVARLKMLSGGDEVMANPKYYKPFTFNPVFTIILATNHAPKASGTDTAVWRRIRAIPFKRVIKKRDRKMRLHLSGKIGGEEADPRHQQAVLAWLIQGARDYVDHGLGEVPASVLASTEATRGEMDPLWEFLEHECVLDAGAWTPTDVLASAYGRHAAERGTTPVDAAAWGVALKGFGASPQRRTVGRRIQRGWTGIRLREAAAHDTGHDTAPDPQNGQEGGRKADSGGA